MISLPGADASVFWIAPTTRLLVAGPSTVKYQISGADDGLPDTRSRSESQWQFTTLGHTTFEPVDNLAYYGWRRFRDGVPGEGIEKHRVSNMAWPLHAIGDATVPMHVAATSSWGHRPFEDGQEEIWSKLRMARDALANAAPPAASSVAPMNSRLPSFAIRLIDPKQDVHRQLIQFFVL